MGWYLDTLFCIVRSDREAQGQKLQLFESNEENFFSYGPASIYDGSFTVVMLNKG